ncbi:MAG: CCA tRNA nucleotidyltransferase [Planktomarina sp.]
MRVAPSWLQAPDLQKIFDALGDYQVFAVGGCVRNELLERPITDIDMSTNATPTEVIAALHAAGIKTVPTGIDHGTITAVLDEPYEITTFRRDVATDGRRAVVAFADTIDADSLRRDFTVNALYVDRDGVVHDPQNGLTDIDPFRLRFIGDADARIEEDYLRILRFFRFFAQYGDPAHGIDADGLAACAAGADGLNDISRERIGQEMLKLLAANDPAPALAAMAQSGVLLRVVPGADVVAFPILVHFESLAGASPSAVRRLALLGNFDPMTAFRVSKAQALTYHQLRDAALDDISPAVTGYRLGAELGLDAVLIRAALTQMPPAEGAAAQVSWGAKQVFPLVAVDIMADYSGPALGVALKSAKDTWIASGFTATKADLIEHLRSA